MRPVVQIKSGVYLIRCLTNEKVYVGSSVDIQRRWQTHLRNLRRNRHHSPKLQSAWNKYGAEAFEWSIAESVLLCGTATDDKASLTQREQYHIDCSDAFLRGFNCSPQAVSSLGRKLSDETKAKISAAHRGKPSHNKGKPMHAAVQASLLAANRGRKLSAEHKAKMAVNSSGRKLSGEARAKISASKHGLKLSAETRAKISAANIGKTLSEEHKAKISASLTADKQSMVDHHHREIGLVHPSRDAITQIVSQCASCDR